MSPYKQIWIEIESVMCEVKLLPQVFLEISFEFLKFFPIHFLFLFLAHIKSGLFSINFKFSFLTY